MGVGTPDRISLPVESSSVIVIPVSPVYRNSMDCSGCQCCLEPVFIIGPVQQSLYVLVRFKRIGRGVVCGGVTRDFVYDSHLLSGVC